MKRHILVVCSFLLLPVALAELTACKSKSPVTPPVLKPSPLLLLRATWGVQPDGPVADVTQDLAARIREDSLDVEVSPKTLGDPAPKLLKLLVVEYRRGDIIGKKIAGEGERLTLRPGDKPRLVIVNAVYGDLAAGKTVDVTRKIELLVRNDALSVIPSNDLFGDPAPRRPKRLRVNYTLDGAAKSATGDEE